MLNKSYSESDLGNASFDNARTVLSQNVQEYVQYCNFNKKFPSVIKRAIYVEEIIPVEAKSPGIFRTYMCNSFIGQSTPNVTCLEKFSIPDVFRDTFFNRDKPNLSLSKQSISSVGINNYVNDCGITPMDIDISNDSKTDDCVSIETMEIDVDVVDNTRNINVRGKRGDVLCSTWRDPGLDSLIYKRKIGQNQTDVIDSNESNFIYSKSSDNKSKIFPTGQIQKNQSHYNLMILLIISLIAGLSYVYGIQDLIYVKSDVQIQNLKNDLIANVHEQKNIVNIIIHSLQQRKHWVGKMKVLSFVGTEGVGKTFVANIVKKHFHQDLVHEMYGNQLSYKSQWKKMFNLNTCCLNLIIIDDLKKKDVMELFEFIYSLPKDQFILVISIFTIQDTDESLNSIINYNDINEIRIAFDKSNLCHEFIVFHEFNDIIVRAWTERQLKLQKVRPDVHKQILTKVLEGHNAKYRGLKGIYSKLLLELERNR